MVVAWAAASHADVLTADRAVQIALQHSTLAVNAEADVIAARSVVQGSYSGILPRFSLDVSRSGSKTEGNTGTRLFGTVVTGSTTPNDVTSYSTTPQLSGTWSVLDLSALKGASAARKGVKAAELRRTSTRQDLAFSTRRQFNLVVTTIKLAEVAVGALHLARDDERRVRALYEVGSVSKSDVLRAQLRTAQGQLDSLTTRQAIINQRILLAELMGVAELEMGDLDTLLTAEIQTFDEAALLQEAANARPDLKAAEIEWQSAKGSLRSAQFLRLPYIAVSGQAQYQPKSSFKQQVHGQIPDGAGGTLVDPVFNGRSESDRVYGGQVSLNWDLFTGFATESRISAAKARVLRAEEARAALRRNLADEVHQALLAYNEAAERHQVAKSAIESATETVKLTQQKYNVGSATILDLIDAQVVLQRAQSEEVLALSGIRNAEAQIARVRGRAV
jgi:outer membrane protein TolC